MPTIDARSMSYVAVDHSKSVREHERTSYQALQCLGEYRTNRVRLFEYLD